MVTKNNRGFHEWIVQRVSAVLIGVYTAFLLVYFLTHYPLHYFTWHTLFSYFEMKITTILVIVAILWHAWIGLWTVLTDYVKNKILRFMLEIAVILLLLGYLIWGLIILF